MSRTDVRQAQYIWLLPLDPPLPIPRILDAKEMETLSGALKRRLQIFAEHVPKETTIEVEVNSEKAARELIGEYFLTGF